MTTAQPKPTVRAPGARALATYLADEISSGRFAAGSKLPPERSLSEQFGASRGVVRKVLQELKEQGLIRQAVGSGTFVAPGAARDVAPPGPVQLDDQSLSEIQTSPAELMQARLLIEPLMPELIVRNATAVDFSLMLECIERSETAGTIEEFEHWDGALHRAFALATHNSFFLKVLVLTNQIREQGEWGRLKRRSLTPDRRHAYQLQHRAIVDALRDRDAEASAVLLRRHLREIQGNLFGN